MNKYSSQHLKNLWPVYVIWAVLAFVICSLFASIATATLRVDKLDIFLAYQVNNTASMENYVKEQKPSYIKEVNFKAYDVTNSYFSIYFTTDGVSNSDILLLPYSCVNTQEKVYSLYQSCIPFPEQYLGLNTKEDDMNVVVNEQVYGLRVYNFEQNNGVLMPFLQDILKKDEDYYLFINASSVHISDLDKASHDEGVKDCLEAMKRYAI